MVDMNKALRNVLSTGKVLIGTKQTIDAVKNKKAKGVVVSSSCPQQTLNKIKGIPIIRFPESSVELGSACGKPFPIMVMAILDAGESDILSLASNRSDNN